MRYCFSLTIAAAVATLASVSAQQPATPAPPLPALATLAQRYAPIDLSGTWVSVVSEDWAVRMITPPKGDFESLPLTPAARDVANKADLTQLEAAGRACDAYGAPALLRQPGRIRFSWQDASTLRIEADAGQQVRVLHFGSDAPRGAASRQGYSTAEWQYANGFDPIRASQVPPAGARAGGGRGGGGGGGGRGAAAANAPSGGRLKVFTDNLTAGLLRKNGVPYSANTTLTEYFNLLTEPGGTRWLVVTTVVHDPENLLVDYIMSSNFKQEPDGSKWKPEPCSLK